jgi:hypothetical protein
MVGRYRAVYASNRKMSWVNKKIRTASLCNIDLLHSGVLTEVRDGHNYWVEIGLFTDLLSPEPGSLARDASPLEDDALLLDIVPLASVSSRVVGTTWLLLPLTLFSGSYDIT